MPEQSFQIEIVIILALILLTLQFICLIYKARKIRAMTKKIIEKQAMLAEQQAIPVAVKGLVRGDGEPGSYKRARGAIPWKEGDEPSEDIIRRLRDNE